MRAKGPSFYGIPGSDYIDRVGQAWLNALTAQREIVNDAWEQMRKGAFDLPAMMRSWTQTADSYFEVITEASRGPGFIDQPVWLSFSYTKRQPEEEGAGARARPRSRNAQPRRPAEKGPSGRPDYLADTVRISRPEAAQTDLEPTRFSNLSHPCTIEPDDAYQVCGWVDGSRSRIHVELKRDALDNADQGQYMSFILPKGRTGESPLVIVMLQIFDAP